MCSGGEQLLEVLSFVTISWIWPRISSMSLGCMCVYVCVSVHDWVSQWVYVSNSLCARVYVVYTYICIYIYIYICVLHSVAMPCAVGGSLAVEWFTKLSSEPSSEVSQSTVHTVRVIYIGSRKKIVLCITVKFQCNWASEVFYNF